jgi:hypothetical protein
MYYYRIAQMCFLVPKLSLGTRKYDKSMHNVGVEIDNGQ